MPIVRSPRKVSFRPALGVGIVVAGIMTWILATGRSARADDEGPIGWEIGLRASYALPFGNVLDDGVLNASSMLVSNPEPITQLVKGAVPLRLDAGYRWTPHLFVGAFFQYEFLVTNDACTATHTLLCNNGNFTHTGYDAVLGASAQYHLLPSQQLDPWLGVGAGFEWATVGSTSAGDAHYSMNGWLIDIDVGADYRVGPALGVGPFVSLGLGEYLSAGKTYWRNIDGPVAAGGAESVSDKALHGWVTLGLRGLFDFRT